MVESACQCKRCKRYRFDPWVGKIPWRRAWQATPIFLPRQSHGEKSLVGYSPCQVENLAEASKHTHPEEEWTGGFAPFSLGLNSVLPVFYLLCTSLGPCQPLFLQLSILLAVLSSFHFSFSYLPSVIEIKSSPNSCPSRLAQSCSAITTMCRERNLTFSPN